MSLRLHTIIASTRPNRVGAAVGHWMHGVAGGEGRFEAHLLDLADFALPVLDEPRHPRLQQYEHDHTRAWAESVAAADAFVFVTPEYNHGPTPALVNALNFVYREWNYKPAGFASYGGISGGLRGVQAIKPTMTTLKLVPLPEAVTLPMVSDQVSEGVFTPTDGNTEAARTMLAELARWAEALKPLRGAG